MKTKARIKANGEVFTPEWLVNQMLDKLNSYGKESWEPNKTFLDPACGNGNMLICVLQRKLSLNHNPSEALRSLYGVDLMKDNVLECQTRLLALVGDSEAHRAIVENNIVCANGLEYDYSFGEKEEIVDTFGWLK